MGYPVTGIKEAAEQYSNQLWRLSNLYYIINKSGKRVKFIPNTSQLKLYNDMWYRTVILKARQRGFTTFIDIFALDSCVFNKDFNAGIIAHNLEDSKKIFRTKVKYPYESLPDGIKNTVGANNDKAGEYQFSNNSNISVSTSYRSGTLQLLHVSEYGKIAAKYPERAKEVVTGAFEAVPIDGVILVESTAEGNGGAFYEMVEKSRNTANENRKPNIMEFKFFFEPWHDNEDYALKDKVIITSEHKKYFDRLRTDYDISLTKAQKSWYVGKLNVLEDDMTREYPSYPDEAFEAAIHGSFYARQMAKARKEGRITGIPIESSHEIHTFWDLGKNDTTAIWFMQQVGKEIRWVDYYESNGEEIEHYCKVLKDKDYLYGKHYMPHDVETNLLGLKSSRKRQFESGGVHPIVVVPRINSVMDGIASVRQQFSAYWFDSERCSEGIKCLDNYQKEWNEKTATFREYPLHNWASNGADAIRQQAQGYKDNKITKNKRSPQPKVSVI